MSSGPNYYYTWTPARPAESRLSTSRKELTSISIAFVVLTVDLTIIFSGGGLLVGSGTLFAHVSLATVLVAAGAALTGFVFHELAHKVWAQRHGFWAEFRMSPFGLVFSLMTSAAGFLWAAPGATVVSGISPLDRKNWGETSLAGPVSNVLFGALFYAGSTVAFVLGSVLYPWLLLLAWVNLWWAAFNLIPVGPLDGAKVLRWRPAVWVSAFFPIAAFAALTTLISLGVTTPLLGR